MRTILAALAISVIAGVASAGSILFENNSLDSTKLYVWVNDNEHRLAYKETLWLTNPKSDITFRSSGYGIEERYRAVVDPNKHITIQLRGDAYKGWYVYEGT